MNSDGSRGGFVHSIKVPQLYKSASKIVQTVVEQGGSIKQLLYNTVRSNLKGVYALVTKTIKNNERLDILLSRTHLLEQNPQLNQWLAKTLITELLLGKGCLTGESKPVQTILQYRESLFKEWEVNPTEDKEDSAGTAIYSFLLCTAAMFTVPFLTFFGVRDVLQTEFGIIGYAATAWAVVASVFVANLIILIYVWIAFKEEQAEEKENAAENKDK